MKYREFLEILNDGKVECYTDDYNSITLRLCKVPDSPVSFRVACGTSKEIENVSFPTEPHYEIHKYTKVMVNITFGYSGDKKASYIANKIARNFSKIKIDKLEQIKHHMTSPTLRLNKISIVNQSIKLRQLYCILCYVQEAQAKADRLIDLWS